jgi:hypothetical protein
MWHAHFARPQQQHEALRMLKKVLQALIKHAQQTWRPHLRRAALAAQPIASAASALRQEAQTLN